MDQIFGALKTCADKNKLLFVNIVKQSLNKILGNAASETLIYCLGGETRHWETLTSWHVDLRIGGM